MLTLFEQNDFDTGLPTYRLKAILCLKDVLASVLRKVSDDTNAFMLKRSVRRRPWRKLCSPKLQPRGISSSYLQFMKKMARYCDTFNLAEEGELLNYILLWRRR